MNGIKEKTFLGMQVENKINTGDILSMIGIFGAVVVVSFGVWRELYDRTSTSQERILVIENQITTIKIQAEKDRADIKDDLYEIKEAIKDVNKQLINNGNKQ